MQDKEKGRRFQETIFHTIEWEDVIANEREPRSMQNSTPFYAKCKRIRSHVYYGPHLPPIFHCKPNRSQPNKHKI